LYGHVMTRRGAEQQQCRIFNFLNPNVGVAPTKGQDTVTWSFCRLI
jgi:hypothetical protein